MLRETRLARWWPIALAIVAAAPAFAAPAAKLELKELDRRLVEALQEAEDFERERDLARRDLEQVATLEDDVGKKAAVQDAEQTVADWEERLKGARERLASLEAQRQRLVQPAAKAPADPAAAALSRCVYFRKCMSRNCKGQPADAQEKCRADCVRKTKPSCR